MKEYIKKHWLKFSVIAIGLLAGYLYWRFIGCNTGTCPITANWYSSTAIGGVLGYLISDSISDILKRRENKKHEGTLG